MAVLRDKKIVAALVLVTCFVVVATVYASTQSTTGTSARIFSVESVVEEEVEGKPCLEISNPLDPWTQEAIGNESLEVCVKSPSYDSWMLAPVWDGDYKCFRYDGTYYVFDCGHSVDYAPPYASAGGIISGAWLGIGACWGTVGLIRVRSRSRRRVDDNSKS